MSDPKDVMDVLSLIEQVGAVAAQIRANGKANFIQDLPLLATLWQPFQTLLGDAPGAVVEVPLELGKLDAQGVADVFLKLEGIYKTWAKVFVAPVAPTTPAA